MFYRHPVFFAGIALASTYMTVLGLDNGKSKIGAMSHFQLCSDQTAEYEWQSHI